MIAPESFAHAILRGGFTIVAVEVSSQPMFDALQREAIARSRIVGREIWITVRSDLDDKEFSVTLYHEILEAMTVAGLSPPASVMEFIEGDFERAGYEAFDMYGAVSRENLNRMLQFYGFHER